MFMLKPMALAEASSGGLAGITGTINELDSHPSVDSESLRGDVRKITGNYYQLLLAVDQDLSFSLGHVFELEQRVYPQLHVSVTISHLEKINQCKLSSVFKCQLN